LRALLSVANRDGLAPFARRLVSLGVELFATDGTREALAADGIDARPIPDLTGAAPLAGGQVKTFHPAIYAGILARRDQPEQLEELERSGFAPLDVVVVNVKPFAPQVGARIVPIHEAVEMIDVAGVALLSAAARNFAGVAAVSDPQHYDLVADEIALHGLVSAETRQRLAAHAFATVAAYNAEVAGYLTHISSIRFPQKLTLVLDKLTDLRYGENPQQRGAFYRETTHRRGTLADSSLLQGEQPSFNDLLDLDVAYRIATDFTLPTVCIAKQSNPVGLASADTLAEAYSRALEVDPANAFGAVLGVNREVDAVTAELIIENVYEAVIAPGYSQHALAVLSGKPDLALLEVPASLRGGLSDYGIADLDLKRVTGGVLVQTADTEAMDRSQLRVVTDRRPTLDELTDLLFAWRAVRHVTSVGVVLARHQSLVGVGPGQCSRLLSVEIALKRAADRSRGSVLASDAYFPFADAIALASERGVTAIIQPGGSVRDEMAVEIADRHHMAMVFTGRRHFRHGP
jgi:phosphoribosylaminoimidazolecarboxamide formyltransferase / IMP cyclohydrolase